MQSEQIIDISNLSYRYPDGTQALSDVSLSVEKGESVGLIGPNGAGKSTLLLHLNGFLRADSKITICGLGMTKDNLSAIRAKVGMIFQDSDDQLFMPTVFDDVAFGPLNMGYSEDEVRGRTKKSLQAVGMEGHEKKAPHHLSGGEKKRIAIATVLSMDLEVLVMDEPSSNLDPRARRSLMNLLRELKTTKVIATHDLELVAELCDRCFLLDGGEVIAHGGVKDILCNKELLESHGLEKPLSLER